MWFGSLHAGSVFRLNTLYLVLNMLRPLRVTSNNALAVAVNTPITSVTGLDELRRGLAALKHG